MRWTTRLLFVSAALSTSACMGGFGRDPGDADPGFEDRPQTSCPVDPDCAARSNCSIYECPDYWECDDEHKRCWNPGPDYPDDGQWDCEDVGHTTVCRGRNFPSDGGGSEWNCEQQGEFVVCTDDSPSYPSDGGGNGWNCWFEGDLRICEEGGGGDGGGGWQCWDTESGRECRNNNPDYPDDGQWSCWDDAGVTRCRRRGGDFPDGGGGGDWNCEQQGEFIVCSDDTPDYPDGGGGGDWDCTFGDEFRLCTDGGGGDGGGGSSRCTLGQQRWCDSPMYCSWGRQACLPDGTWGICEEAPVNASTGWLQDRPDTACACRNFYFNEACCEDQQDRDGDGHADCLVPTAHTAPACESDGSYCSYCDGSSTHCGSSADACLRAPGTTYWFCAQSCLTSSDCPAGAQCSIVASSGGSFLQCVPRDLHTLCGDITW
ncbi:MAG: hypothetical protein AB7S26_22375 [Sandaracinaceae bacterium]